MAGDHDQGIILKKFTSRVLATFALAAPLMAHAGLVVLVDSFDAPAQFVYDTSTASGAGVTQTSTGVAVNAPTNSIATRTVTHELLLGSNAGPPSPGAQSNARVGVGFPPGTLAITNTSGRDSKVVVSWALPAAFIPDASTLGPARLAFDLLLTDQSVSADLYFDDNLFGTLALAQYNGIAAYPVLAPVSKYFALTAAQQNQIAASTDKVLRLELNGPTGWDLRIDNLRFEVPEPGSLPLAALALAGAAAALRRRKAVPASEHPRLNPHI